MLGISPSTKQRPIIDLKGIPDSQLPIWDQLPESTGKSEVILPLPLSKERKEEVDIEQSGMRNKKQNGSRNRKANVIHLR